MCDRCDKIAELWSAAKAILLEDYGNNASKLEALVGRAIRIMDTAALSSPAGRTQE